MYIYIYICDIYVYHQFAKVTMPLTSYKIINILIIVFFLVLLPHLTLVLTSCNNIVIYCRNISGENWKMVVEAILLFSQMNSKGAYKIHHW